MIEPTSEQWFAIIAVAIFFISAFLNILFYRISVMYIERELVKEDEGFKPLELDKGIGARGMMYNQLILFKIKKHPYVDGEAVIRIARKKDWWLAFLSFHSLWLAMLPMMMGYFLYAD
jgi:hypothetical protein